jgi:phage shock protein PspC (stress-responsive transcriptional regulator)
MGMKRAKRDRWILGVCGGIGHSLGFSPLGVRLIFILLAIFLPGVGILIDILGYLGLGLLLPESDEF